MAQEVVQHRLRGRLRKVIIVMVLLVLGSAALYVGYMQYSLYLAKRFVPIPSDASNLRAFYIGIGQSHTVYIRFDLVVDSEDAFLSELCEDRYSAIDDQTNPFQDMPSGWWMPRWWTPPQNPDVYLGGECYSPTYKILIDKKTGVATTYIMAYH